MTKLWHTESIESIVLVHIANTGVGLLVYWVGRFVLLFLFNKLNVNNGQVSVSNDGAALYLSERTIHSQIANL